MYSKEQKTRFFQNMSALLHMLFIMKLCPAHNIKKYSKHKADIQIHPDVVQVVLGKVLKFLIHFKQ